MKDVRAGPACAQKEWPCVFFAFAVCVWFSNDIIAVSESANIWFKKTRAMYEIFEVISISYILSLLRIILYTCHVIWSHVYNRLYMTYWWVGIRMYSLFAGLCENFRSCRELSSFAVRIYFYSKMNFKTSLYSTSVLALELLSHLLFWCHTRMRFSDWPFLSLLSAGVL